MDTIHAIVEAMRLQGCPEPEINEAVSLFMEKLNRSTMGLGDPLHV